MELGQFQETTCRFIKKYHFRSLLAITNDIILVLFIEQVGTKRKEQVTGKGAVFLIVEITDTKVIFSSLSPFSSQPNFTFFLFEDIVLTLNQGGHKRIHHPIIVRLNTGRTRDNQRCLCTVKEDRIHLIDNSIVKGTHVFSVLVRSKVINQIVKA